MPEQTERVPESAVDVSPEKTDAKRQRIDAISDQKNKQVNSIVRTDAPEKPEVEEKPDDKPDIKKKAAKPTTGQITHEATNVRRLDSSNGPPAETFGPAWFAPASAVGLTAAGATMATFSPSVISQIPLIGKIPYLPQAAAAFRSGIQSVLSPLGLGTGLNATNSFMYSWLPTGLGYYGVGSLAVPAGLWSIGMIKSLITGKKYGLKDKFLGGPRGYIQEGARTITGAPFYLYDKIMNARYKGGEIAKSTWNTATAPIRGTWNLGKTIAKGTWKGAKEATTAALKPTWSGGIGAGIGSVLGVMGAPLTGGASLIASPLLGYGAGNIFKNSGALEGRSQTASAK